MHWPRLIGVLAIVALLLGVVGTPANRAQNAGTPAATDGATDPTPDLTPTLESDGPAATPEAPTPTEFPIAPTPTELPFGEPPVSDDMGTEIAVADDEGDFSASSVGTSGQLSCSPANTYGPNNDGAVPGQILHYSCTLTTGLLSTLSGSVSLTAGAADGWQFRLIYNVQILSVETTVDSGWTSSTQTLGGLSLIAGAMTINIDLRAPSQSLTPSSGPGDSRATLAISATASSGCGTLGVAPCSGSATINAYAAMTESSSGGGQLLGLVSGLAGLTPGQALFSITCGAIPNGYTVAPGVRVSVNCQFQSLAALQTLLGAATISSNLTLSSTNSGWDFALAPGMNADFSTNTGSTLFVNLGNVIDVGGFNNGWFTVFFTPTGYCGEATGNLLDSMIVEATYQLTLVSSVSAPVSNGYAVVPVRVEGAGDVPAMGPAVAANDLDFATFIYTGSGYTGGAQRNLGVMLNQPANDCLATDWYVTVQYSPLTGYADAGHTTPLDPATSIPVGSLGYVGAPSGGTGAIHLSNPAPSGGADVIVEGTDPLTMPHGVSYTLQLTPPNTQRVGHYRGTVTVTSHTGTAP